MKYNLDKLKEIPISEVLASIGADYAMHRYGRLMHCFNIEAHKNQDKKPSLAIYEKTNSCHCFACGLSGGPIDMAKIAFNGDFKKACEWLHVAWNIPFLEISNNQAIKPNVPKRNLTLKEKIRHFDPQKKYQNIALRDIFSQYAYSSRNMQLKMVYTFIYRYSLMTEQKKKESYYNNRGITCDVKEIGFLGWEDVTRLEQELTKYFSIQDLQDFKVFSKKKYGWNYSRNVAVVPCFDLYTDLICGFSLRAISGDSTVKELNVNCSDIEIPLPFNLKYSTLKEKEWIWITEGHIDALSGVTKNKKENIDFCSFAGAWAYKEEILGLFKNKKVIIAFDKDIAGKNSEATLVAKLLHLGIETYIADWSEEVNDLNDLLNLNALNTIKVHKQELRTA